MDKKAFFKISYGLYLISSQYDNRESGCIANSFFQITDNPIQVCTVLNKNNYTTALIKKSLKFNCAVLLKDTPMEIIKQFGFQSGKNINKFEGIDTFKDCLNIKQYGKVAVYYSCEVINVIDVGTHYMFIAKVVDTKILSDDPILTYSDYHKRKSKKGYRCSVCGYIYEGDNLPDDYICPVCKVDASYFEKVE